MGLLYLASSYRSHLRAARSYCDIIRDDYKLTTNVYLEDPSQIAPDAIDLADVQIVILHLEPSNFDRLYQRYPILFDKYVIGYCVWEASELPECYKRSISYLQEVWTCSDYSARIFKTQHQNVSLVPHIIERDAPSAQADRDYVAQAIDHSPDNIYFLTVTRETDKRKNISTLLRAFDNCSRRMPRARLIVKSTPVRTPTAQQHNVRWLSGNLTESQLTALYELADVYVSPHHSEAWGLTLSDAMLLRKPTIATGYSGNCDFMAADNSFLLRFDEEYIRSEDCFGLFTSQMKWAYPNERHLEETLLELYESKDKEYVQKSVDKASSDLSRFSRSGVRPLIRERLSAIAQAVGVTS